MFDFNKREWAKDGICIQSEIHLSFWDSIKTLLRCPIYHSFMVHTDCMVEKHELEETICVGKIFPHKLQGQEEIGTK